MSNSLKILFVLSALLACSEKATTPPPEPPVTPPVDPPIERIHLVEGWPSWSPDGRYIFYHRPARNLKELIRFGERSIWAYDTQTGSYGFFLGPGMFAKWNPDGTILAFNGGGNVFFYYPSSRTVRQVSYQGEVFTFNWNPNGRSLVLQDGRLIDTLGNIYYHLLPWDGSHGGWRGAGHARWSSDGLRLLVTSLDPNGLYGLIVIDTLGSVVDTIAMANSAHDGFLYPSWSPDEARITVNYGYVKAGRSYDEWRLYASDGVLLRVLSFTGGVGEWSPDGSKIAFHARTFMGRTPYPELEPDYARVTVWICNSDGSEMHELLPWPQPYPDPDMFNGGYNWVTDVYGP